MPAPGQYGRRPAKRAPAIAFSAIRRAAALPPVPAAVDYLAQTGPGWLMLGNGPDDSVFPGFPGAGDCVAVMWANTRRAVSKIVAGHEVYPGWTAVLDVYRTQNPRFNPHGGSSTGPGSDADQGMDIQSLLEFLTKHPGPDGSQLIGFAAVNPQDPAEVNAAIAAGGVLWLGIDVLAANEDEFGHDQPWDYIPGSPVAGGHGIACGGYGHEAGDPALAGDKKFVTWAAETSFTAAFWQHQVRELWFPVWKEQLSTAEFQAGVDVAAFAAEFTAITGRPFPAPVLPDPGPDDADLTLYRQTHAWTGMHHVGQNAAVARDLKLWYKAKGLG